MNDCMCVCEVGGRGGECVYIDSWVLCVYVYLVPR